LGFQADEATELAELKQRAQADEIALLDEGETTCCYARSDKHWITDPQGGLGTLSHAGQHPGLQ
jgi:lactoylglutathione lyase